MLGDGGNAVLFDLGPAKRLQRVGEEHPRPHLLLLLLLGPTVRLPGNLGEGAMKADPPRQRQELHGAASPSADRTGLPVVRLFSATAPQWPEWSRMRSVEMA